MSLYAYLNSQGPPHCDTAQDMSLYAYLRRGPHPCDKIKKVFPEPPPHHECFPPQQNVYDEEKIKEIVLKYLSDATDGQVGLITEKVLENINPTIEINIEQKIIEAFSELGIISNEEIDEITSN